ncbi:MAG TPA: hypothetical protein VLE69_01505 [Candidatus Saccharimonadales bacterium]|nr:hypothetical protein [Candidatus Saccharimonadales bacterium]
MKSKVVKIVIDIVLSFMFLIVASILVDWIAGMIFGKKSSGSADFNGGVLLTITVMLTLVFAVWFYKYVHLGKSDKTEE